MVRRILQCDICGDKWDITDTELNDSPTPSWSYITYCVEKGKRKYILKKACYDKGCVDTDFMDICCECYRKINDFIMSIAGEGDPE